MRVTLISSTLALLAVFGSAASAAECDGVSFEEEIRVEGSSLKLNGLGLRLATILKVKVYVAALYVAAPSEDAKAILEAKSPRRLVLHFVRSVDAGDLNEAWEEGFEHTAKSQLSSLQPRIDKLKGWMADMKAGERLSFTSKPGVGIKVEVNGKVAGTIAGEDFATAFLAIWLGDHPPNPTLKSGLLGGPCE